MINWKCVICKDSVRSEKYISEDGRFEIKKEDKWYLYDEKASDMRWCRIPKDSLKEAQNAAERIPETVLRRGEPPAGRLRTDGSGRTAPGGRRIVG